MAKRNEVAYWAQIEYLSEKYDLEDLLLQNDIELTTILDFLVGAGFISLDDYFYQNGFPILNRHMSEDDILRRPQDWMDKLKKALDDENE